MASSEKGSKKRALLLLAQGSEDVEVAIPSYVMRQGGIETVVASVDGGVEGVKCVQGLVVVPDASLEEAHASGPFDVIFLPGGIEGGPNIAKIKLVGDILKEQEKGDRLVAAICFSPALTLVKYGIYSGKKMTCYPMAEMMQIIVDSKTHSWVDEGVVEDGPLITAQGPAFAFDISLAIVKRLRGEEVAKNISSIMLMHK